MTHHHKVHRTQERNERHSHPCLMGWVQTDGHKLTAWQRYDLNWFDAHPDCSYHLRELFYGEYQTNGVPRPYAMLSLVRIDRAGDGQGVPALESCPLALDPPDGFNCLLIIRATPKGQKALHAIWHDQPIPEDCYA